MGTGNTQVPILILALVASTEAILNGCEKGWVPFGKKCYYFSSSTATFKDAMIICYNFGAGLLELQRKWEEDWVDLQCRVRGYLHGVWLGLSDLHSGGQFVTLTDARTPRFRNWMKGEPNNSGSNEHCAMYWSLHKGWNDTKCTGKLNYVCKK